jgi:hypothetical protein
MAELGGDLIVTALFLGHAQNGACSAWIMCWLSHPIV